MQKFLEAPDRKWGRRIPGKQTLPVKRRNSTSLQRYPADRKKVLLLGCSQGSTPVCQVLGLRMWVLSAASALRRRNKYYKKYPKWTYHLLLRTPNLHLSTTKTTGAFQRLILERRLYSNSLERHSSLQSSRVKTRTK